MPGWYGWHDNTLTLRVYVQTRASRDEICGVHDDYLKIRITAPPVDGKANSHLIAFLAKQCGVSQSAVCLVAGSSSRHKQVHMALQKPNLPVVLSRFVNPVEQSGQN